MNEFEDDLWKLIEDYPHPSLEIGCYKICVYDDGDEDDGFAIYKNGLFIEHLEIPQNIIDYFEKVGFDWKDTDYVIE